MGWGEETDSLMVKFDSDGNNFFFQENSRDWITVEYKSTNPSIDDWIGVFSPANFR